MGTKVRLVKIYFLKPCKLKKKKKYKPKAKKKKKQHKIIYPGDIVFETGYK